MQEIKTQSASRMYLLDIHHGFERHMRYTECMLISWNPRL